jgi:hypothetical protein
MIPKGFVAAIGKRAGKLSAGARLAEPWHPVQGSIGAPGIEKLLCVPVGNVINLYFIKRSVRFPYQASVGNYLKKRLVYIRVIWIA